MSQKNTKRNTPTPAKKQVSLAGVANKPQKNEKSPVPWKWIAIGCAFVILLLLGILLFTKKEEEKKGSSLTAKEQVEYVYTPSDKAKEVSYFLLGVTGENIGDTMDMLAVMCYDRKSEKIEVVQIPVSTYIDKDTGFAVDTFGDVWSNPTPEVFCSSCRVRLSEGEIDGKYHASCGSATEERKGSATGDLIRVINEQYGLPIDNYLIIPREGLVALIDAFDGVVVELNQKATLGGETLEKGVRRLSGTAAVEYAITYNYNETPEADRERMLRQRQVLASLWQHLANCDMENLYATDSAGSTKGIIGKLMTSAHPIRFNTSSFGKARLLGLDEEAVEEIKLSDAMARFMYGLGQIPMNNVTFHILPGEAAKNGTQTVYSVHRAQVIELLDEYMNPCNLDVNEDTVVAPQLIETPDEADFETATLDTAMPAEKEEE